MKYLDKTFSTPANSQAYVDGWERVFGGEEKEEPQVPALTQEEGESTDPA